MFLLSEAALDPRFVKEVNVSLEIKRGVVSPGAPIWVFVKLWIVPRQLVKLVNRLPGDY